MKAKSSFHLITGSVLALLILTFSISAQTYQLSGRVYEGTTGQEPPNSSYLSGVTVKLWASDNSGQKETLVESTTTNSEGWYGLSVDVGDYPRDYFIIEEIDPDDYTSDGATSMGGSVLSSNIIQYTYGELSGTVTGNKFWDKPDTPDNEDPVADAGGPYSGTVGQSITLDGSGSSDPDGTINTYEWDLNGDGDYNDAGDKTGQTVQNTWSSAGTYTVNLRVTDNDGAKDSDAASVKISGTEGDTDGDGIPDNVEGTGDRDGDDIPDNEDYDPNGWIYDEITGAIIKGGAITVTPSKGVNIIEDGSLGFYKFTVSKDGQYTLDYTPPAGYKSSLTHVAMAGQLDPDPATDPDPLVVGAGSRNDITNQLTDWSAANNPYYLQFKLSLGDPTIINNNIPLEGQHFDYGDAPLPYPSASHRIDTTAASDMPWFTESDVTLIGQPDAETDMQREPPGLGDNYNGTDDEQGMVVYGDLDVGSVYMDHFMYSGNGSYTCEAWIDLNGDGDWDDPGEKIAKMGGGATSISGLYRMRWYVLVPDTAKAGKTYIRFRVVEGSGVTLTPDGPADFGEVEDYEVEILPEPYDYGDAPLPYPSASHKI
ncbi:PKD domain-containing protein, partial [candidate division KSB1 bacterium]|nr:PKD domain-containing protein [candidate division KSB1 bacterium]